MQRLFIPVLFLVLTAQAVAAQPRPRANALLILSTQRIESSRTIVSAVVAQGGRVDHVFPPNAVIAYVPMENLNRLKAILPIVRIEQGPADMPLMTQYGDGPRLAASVWNATFQETTSASQASPKGEPKKLPGPVRIAPDRPVRRLDLAAATSTAAAPGFMQTSEYFIGSVTVGIIMPESNGAIDTNRENWSMARQDTVVAKIAAGLQWWKDNAHAPANITFVYDVRRSVPTSYEPIRRNSSAEGLWIGQVMANLGYPSGGDSYFTQVRNYLNDIRDQLDTQWAYAIFVADSLNDNDGAFPDGSFAYTYVNGPFMVMTYDNGNWGIELMQLVTAHETAHVWGALDEYASSGCTDTETSGYLNIANTNCENGDPPAEDSIMRGSFNQEFVAFPNHLVSTPARQMIGWRDLDGDGKELYDPIDTIPAVALNPFGPDPTTARTPTYTGTAVDVAFPSPTEAAVTINAIAAVEWRVDGGPWQQAVAADGAFDSEEEDFTFTSAYLPSGVHLFEARATNSVGNVSLIAADSLTILPIVNVNCSSMSLQEALSLIAPGDTVSVTGACNENILIRNESARLVLDGGGTAAIHGVDPTRPAINVRGKGILVKNFTVTGGSSGIEVNRGSNAVIDNNVIGGTVGHGIVVNQLAFAAITNNTVQNNPGAGIFVGEASMARIGFNDDGETVASANTIQNNGVGVMVINDSSARVVGNTISGNANEGLVILRSSSADVASNQISSNGSDAILVGENSVAQLGEDSGASIFELPNSTSANNGGFGVACSDGGIVDGRLGTLMGINGATGVGPSCSSGLAP